MDAISANCWPLGKFVLIALTALPGVEGVYDRHDYLDEKRDALERWATHVWEIALPPQEESNVVQLRA
jgi:hypothetical protein